MSSFLDSSGLSRLASKITDYFCKKNGSYANLTAGKVTVQDSAEGTTRDMLCVDSDGKLRKAKNISTYSDSNNGSLMTLGGSDRRGVLRLYDNAGHYSILRTSNDVGASDSTFVLGKPGVIPSKSNDGSDLGGVGTPIYMKTDGRLALCTGIGKEFWIDDTTNGERYITLGSIMLDSGGGLSRLELEIGALGCGYSQYNAGKLIVHMGSFRGDNKVYITRVNIPADIVPNRCRFYTYTADGKMYLVAYMIAYSAGAYAKVISHGRSERPWEAGVLDSSATAPATLTESNVTYQSLTAT